MSYLLHHLMVIHPQEGSFERATADRLESTRSVSMLRKARMAYKIGSVIAPAHPVVAGLALASTGYVIYKVLEKKYD